MQLDSLALADRSGDGRTDFAEFDPRHRRVETIMLPAEEKTPAWSASTLPKQGGRFAWPNAPWARGQQRGSDRWSPWGTSISRLLLARAHGGQNSPTAVTMAARVLSCARAAATWRYFHAEGLAVPFVCGGTSCRRRPDHGASRRAAKPKPTRAEIAGDKDDGCTSTARQPVMRQTIDPNRPVLSMRSGVAHASRAALPRPAAAGQVEDTLRPSGGNRATAVRNGRKEGRCRKCFAMVDNDSRELIALT